MFSLLISSWYPRHNRLCHRWVSVHIPVHLRVQPANMNHANLVNLVNPVKRVMCAHP